MVIAWFVLAFFGMLVARYAKDIDRHLCGKLAWFRIHQICMSTTWILVITGKDQRQRVSNLLLLVLLCKYTQRYSDRKGIEKKF